MPLSAATLDEEVLWRGVLTDHAFCFSSPLRITPPFPCALRWTRACGAWLWVPRVVVFFCLYALCSFVCGGGALRVVSVSPCLPDNHQSMMLLIVALIACTTAQVGTWQLSQTWNGNVPCTGIPSQFVAVPAATGPPGCFAQACSFNSIFGITSMTTCVTTIPPIPTGMVGGSFYTASGCSTLNGVGALNTTCLITEAGVQSWTSRCCNGVLTVTQYIDGTCTTPSPIGVSVQPSGCGATKVSFPAQGLFEFGSLAFFQSNCPPSGGNGCSGGTCFHEVSLLLLGEGTV